MLEGPEGLRGDVHLMRAGAEGDELAHHVLLSLSVQDAKLRHCRNDTRTEGTEVTPHSFDLANGLEHSNPVTM